MRSLFLAKRVAPDAVKAPVATTESHILTESYHVGCGLRHAGPMPSIRSEPWLAACAVVVVGQYAWVGLTSDLSDVGISTYGKIAWNLHQSLLYSSDGEHLTYRRPPLYPLLLWASVALGQSSWETIARVLQACLGLGSLFLVHHIATTVFRDRRAVAIAVGLYAADWALHMEQLSQRDTVLIEFLTLLFVAVGLRAGDSRRGACFAAAIAGLAFLTRPTGIVLLPALLLALGLTRLAWRERCVRIGLCVLVFQLLLLPWQAFHVAGFGSFSFGFPTNGGMNLFKGNAPLGTAVYPAVDPDRVDDEIRTLTAGMTQHEKDAYLRDRAVEEILSEPDDFVARAIEKTFYFFSPHEVPFGKGTVVADGAGGVRVDAYRVEQGTKALLLFPLAFVVLPLGCLGLAAALRRPGEARRFGSMALAVVLGTLAISAVTFAQLRFRLPVVGLLCIAAGFALARIFPPREDGSP